jgi:hypothetical protein
VHFPSCSPNISSYTLPSFHRHESHGIRASLSNARALSPHYSRFSTYLFQRDDIVWQFVKDLPHNRLWERSCFAVATLFIGTAAALCTWQRAFSPSNRPPRYAKHLGDILYAVGLGSLAPLFGFLILVIGQILLTLRLMNSEAPSEMSSTRKQLSPPSEQSFAPNWPQAARHEIGKWAIFLTMIVFTITLIDRVAEVLALARFLVWLVFNFPSRASASSNN